MKKEDGGKNNGIQQSCSYVDRMRSFRDVCAQHAERMARIDAMLNSIKERLGV